MNSSTDNQHFILEQNEKNDPNIEHKNLKFVGHIASGLSMHHMCLEEFVHDLDISEL